MNFIIIIVFYSSIFIRPIIVVSSSSIIIIWLSLELRVFSFLPIIISSQTFSAIKYFFVQRVGSVIILFSSIYSFSSRIIRFLIIALILKLGIAPLHFWLPSLVSSLQASEILILLVWQKIGPLFIIIMLPFQTSAKIFIGVFRALVGRVSGIKQTQWRQIFTFSSINHLGWILVSGSLSFWLFFVYFFIYAISLIQIFFINSIKFLNSSIYSFTRFRVYNLFILLSLAGLPPILGFVAKLLVLFYLLVSPIIVLVIFLLISFSIIRLFFYLKIFFSLVLSSSRLELTRNNILIFGNLIIFLSFPLILNFLNISIKKCLLLTLEK